MNITEKELLIARLARMKMLINSLEAECESVEQMETCIKLKQELEAVRAAVRLLP